MDIQWTSQGLAPKDKVTISLLCDGVETKGMGLPKTVPASDGLYQWKLPKKLPKKLPSGEYYRIRIERKPTKLTKFDPPVWDESDNAFSIER